MPRWPSVLPPELKREVDRLVTKGEIAQSFADAIYNYRDQVNYDYWKLRCEDRTG